MGAYSGYTPRQPTNTATVLWRKYGLVTSNVYLSSLTDVLTICGLFGQFVLTMLYMTEVDHV